MTVAVLVDSVAIGDSAAAASFIETGTLTPTGQDQLIVAKVGSGATSPSDPTSVKYASASGVGGEDLALQTPGVKTLNTNVKGSVWILANPIAASGTIYVTYAGSDDERWCIGEAWKDTDGSLGPLTYAFAVGDNAPTVNAVSSSGAAVSDYLFVLDGSGSSCTIAVGAGQSSIKELEGGGTGGTGSIGPSEAAGSSQEIAGVSSPTVMSWTMSQTRDWGLFGFQVNGKNEGISGGLANPSFKQFPFTFRPRPFGPGNAR